MTNSASIFWETLQRCKAEVEGLIFCRDMRSAFDIVENALQNAGFDLAFELAGKVEDYYLIFSPEGDSQEAIIIDALIEKAPDLEMWTILGRKPRKPMPDPLVFVERIFGLRLDDSRFLFTSDGECSIRVFSSAFRGLDTEVAHGCAATLLFHLLGEEGVMERVDAIGVSAGRAPTSSLSPEELVAEFDRTLS